MLVTNFDFKYTSDSQSIFTNFVASDFEIGKELDCIYKNLLLNQVELENEFQQVLYDNLWNLYK